MECKNCKTNLKETAKFCDECGGKVINHRLNFKTVTAEFFETFISWDNKFFKTISHLITQPQNVANGYLDGVRKRYMQPFAYMLIALTFYGFYILLSKEILMEYLEQMNKSMADVYSAESQKFSNNFNKKWMNFIMNYYNIFTFATIPLFAFINKLIFKSRNFIEHNVALLYAYGTYLFLSSIIGFIGLILGVDYGSFATISMLLLVGYHMFFYKKMFKLDNATTVLKTLYFWLILITFYVLLMVIGGIIVFILLELKIITP